MSLRSMHQKKIESPSLQNEFENLFFNMRNEIQEYMKVIDSLHKFRQYIDQGVRDGVFDEEDRRWIEEDLQKLTLEKDKKEIEYNNRKQAYEGSILKLENIMNVRKQIIEEADKNTNVFSSRPELLKKFAQKRANLIKIVEQGKKDLQKPMA